MIATVPVEKEARMQSTKNRQAQWNFISNVDSGIFLLSKRNEYELMSCVPFPSVANEYNNDKNRNINNAHPSQSDRRIEFSNN